MMENGTFADGRSPFGLPKTRVQKIVLKKKAKKEAAEGGDAAGAAPARLPPRLPQPHRPRPRRPRRSKPIRPAFECARVGRTIGDAANIARFAGFTFCSFRLH